MNGADENFKELKKCCERGSVDYNPKEASRLAKIICESKKSKAKEEKRKDEQYCFACYVADLWGLSVDLQNGLIDHLVEAATLGVPEAQYRLAYIFRNKNKKRKAYPLGCDEKKLDSFLREAFKTWNAQPEDPNALYWLGKMYNGGFGVEKNVEKAAEKYRAAAALGNAMAMNNLAWMEKSELLTNLGDEEQKYKVALKWFQEAEKQGNTFAYFNLGVMYLRGLGVTRDIKRANNYFQKVPEFLWHELEGPMVNHSCDGFYAMGYFQVVQAIKKGGATSWAKAKDYLHRAVSKKMTKEQTDNERKTTGDAYFLLGLIAEFYEQNMSEALEHYKNAAMRDHVEASSFEISEETMLWDFIFSRDFKGVSRLHAYAALGEYDAMLETIAKSLPLKLVINAVSQESNKTPLHYAAENGQYAVAQKLIDEQGAAVNVSVADGEGNLPIHLAVQRGYPAVVGFLLNLNGKSATVLNNAFKTPLRIAIDEAQDVGVFLAFRDSCTQETLLELALADGNENFVDELNQANILMPLAEQKDKDNNTLFERAIMKQDRGKGDVKVLCKFGVLKAKSSEEKLALLKLIVEKKSKAILRYMLKGAATNGLFPFDFNLFESFVSAYAQRKNVDWVKPLIIRYRPSHAVEKIQVLLETYFSEVKLLGENENSDDIINKRLGSLVNFNFAEAEKCAGSLKYLAQWYGVAGVEKSPKEEVARSFERGNPEDFLAINIKLLFMVIVNNADSLKKDNKFDFLLEELCLELEMLRARLDFTDAYPNDSKKRTERTKWQEGYKSKILESIWALPVNSEYVLNIGYLAHSMYLTITRAQNGFYVQIDDLADGHKGAYAHDYRMEGEEKFIYPRVAFLPVTDKKGVDEILCKYLADVFAARNCDHNTAVVKIYGALKSPPFEQLSKQVLEQKFNARHFQEVNNCVVENFKVGLQSRLEKKQPGLYDFLVQKLISQYASLQAVKREKSVLSTNLGVDVERAEGTAASEMPDEPDSNEVSPRESRVVKYAPQISLANTVEKVGLLREITAENGLSILQEAYVSPKPVAF